MEAIWAPITFAKKSCGLHQGSSYSSSTSAPQPNSFLRNHATLGVHVFTRSFNVERNEEPCSTISSTRVRVGLESALRKTKSFNDSRRLRKAAICSSENGTATEVILEAPRTAPRLQSPNYNDLALHRTGESNADTLFPSKTSSSLSSQELTEVSPFRPGPIVECFEVEGGRALSGEVRISGAKNSALAVLAGTICSEGQVCLQMLPDLHDIRRMFQVLQSVGVKIHKTAAGFVIDASDLTSVEPCAETVRKLRASFFVVGSLLGRKGEAVVPLPGGCNIGARPIDLHVRGLEALGAEVVIRYGLFIYHSLSPTICFNMKFTCSFM